MYVFICERLILKTCLAMFQISKKTFSDSLGCRLLPFKEAFIELM